MGILLAPHVKIKSYQEHLPARIISATMKVKGMIIAVLDVYTPTDSTKSVTAKSVFYSALSKAKPEVDDNPKYKSIILSDLNATISSHSKETDTWNSILGHNSDRVETNDNGERLLTWCLENQMKTMNTILRTTRHISA